MSIAAVWELKHLYDNLSPAQRFKFDMEFGLGGVNLFTLSPERAKEILVLAKAKLTIASANPIKENTRLAELNQKKAQSYNIWEGARKDYYSQLAIYNKDKSDENRALADEKFLDMKLAGEHMVADTKRANNAEIQDILFSPPRDIGWC